MVKLLLTVVILTGPMAIVAAYGQSDGRYAAPELSKPAPGHLLDKDYLTSVARLSPGPAFRSRRVTRRSTAICANRMPASTTASARAVEAPADKGYFRPVARSIECASP